MTQGKVKHRKKGTIKLIYHISIPEKQIAMRPNIGLKHRHVITASVRYDCGFGSEEVVWQVIVPDTGCEQIAVP